jgi:hypothetical protein
MSLLTGRRRRSGSFGLSRSLLDLAGLPAGPRGFPPSPSSPSSRCRHRGSPETGPPELRASKERSLHQPRPISRPPLLGFVRSFDRPPLHRPRPRRPLMGGEAISAFVFRPRGFAPPRRFAPPLARGFTELPHRCRCEDSRACCIPLPILGFHAFPLGAIWLRHPHPPRRCRRG